MHSLARRLPLALLLAVSTTSHAISGSDQVSLAGSGRYSELRRQLETDEQKQALAARADDPKKTWTIDDLVARGSKVYAANCAACHTRAGEGDWSERSVTIPK